MEEKYFIDKNSEEQFLNISRFLKNATIKDSVLLEENENTLSSFFSEILKTYYDHELKKNDILELIYFIENYNTTIVNNSLLVNPYKYLFGIEKDSEESSFYKIQLNKIINNFKKLIENSQNNAEWKKITWKKVINGKLLEGLFLFLISSFIENTGEILNGENIDGIFSLDSSGVMERNLELKSFNSILNDEKIKIILHKNKNPDFNRLNDDSFYKLINDLDKTVILNKLSPETNSKSYLELKYKYLGQKYEKTSKYSGVDFPEGKNENFLYFKNEEGENFNFSKVLYYLKVKIDNKDGNGYEFELPLIELEPDLEDFNDISSKKVVIFSPINKTKEENPEENDETRTFLKYKIIEKNKYRENEGLLNYICLDSSSENGVIGNKKAGVQKNIYNLFENLINEFSSILKTNDDPLTFILPNGYKDYFFDNGKIVFLSNLHEDILNFAEISFLKELIISYTPKIKKEEKFSAGTKEINWIENKEPFCMFNLSFKLYSSDISGENQNIINPDDSIDEKLFKLYKGGIDTLPIGDNEYSSAYLFEERSDNDSDDIYHCNLFILYKELNKEFRKIFLSSLQELIFAIIFKKNNGFPNSLSESNTLFPLINDIFISEGIQDFYRTFSLKNSDLYINDNNFFIFKNLYGNYLLGRKGRESDIIAYYYGDDIISKGYGSNSSDIYEIENFLNLYSETRNYFYRKILNKSFVNDEMYKFYINFLIAIWSIERFISSKIDNIHSIEYFNKTDISNFLQSYGLKALDDVPNFYNKIDYSKKIIQFFTKLVRGKGSKKVIDELIDVFNFNSTEVEIAKHLLIEDQSTAFDIKIISNIDIKWSDEPKLILNNSISLTDESLIDLSQTFSEFFFNLTKIKPSDDAQLKKIKKNIIAEIGSYNEFFSYIKDEKDLKNEKLEKYFKKNDDEISISIELLEKKNDSKLKFIKIPYISENETKEVKRKLPSGINYADFITKDKYWDIKTVPESSLREKIGIEETKYLSLDVKENAYKFFILLQYNFSAINYFYKKFIVRELDDETNTEINILDNIKISDENLGGVLTLNEYFKCIKMLFANLIVLYKKKYLKNKIGAPENQEYAGIDYVKLYFLNGIYRDELGNIVKDNNSINKLIDQKIYYIKEEEIWKYKKWDNDSENFILISNLPKFYGINENFFNNFDSSSFLAFFESLFEDAKKNLFSRTIKEEDTESSITEFSKFEEGEGFYSPFSIILNSKIKNIQYKNETTVLKEALEKLKNFYFANLKLPKEETNLNSGFYVIETLENINTLLLEKEYLFANFLKNSNSEDYFKDFSDAIDFNLFYSSIIERAIKFPVDYLTNGLLYSNEFTKYFFHNKNFLTFCEILFEEAYLTNENPLEVERSYFTGKNIKYNKYIFEDVYSVYPKDGNDEFILKEYFAAEEIQAIENVSNKLIEMISLIKSILSSHEFAQFMFSIEENQDNTLEYLKLALEFFLSYTTKLYDIKYLNIYKSESESVPLAEDIKINIKQKKADYFFYDEKISIWKN